MIVDRRTTLAGLVGGLAGRAVPASAAAAPMVLIVDTRLPTTRTFVAARKAQSVIDLASAHADLWRDVRGASVQGARIAGLTRWSDWIAVRGVMIEKGLRVRAERPIDPAASSDAALFYWEMA